ncbi:MAG: prolyl oligopeptidase family serine peptidase [Prosthecobacter sp.]|nr:prolyl oligopeptidase family serine peptidase [Prosthecobacter sp.]
MKFLHTLTVIAVGLGALGAAAQEREAAGKRHYGPEYAQRVFKGAGGGEFKYGWLAPAQPKAGEKYPLVICLHGSGGNVRASAVLARPDMREKYPSFIVVGECERPFVWAFTDVLGRRKMPANPPEKLPVVIEAVRELLKTEAIDPNRVYIIGQSLGGAGSWGATARYPELFAGAVPICGFWKVEDAPKMATVPVWAFHGADDPTVPVKFSRDLTAGVTKAGGMAKYTEYHGVGHDSWTKACDEPGLWEWLFAQKKSLEK